MVLQPSTEPSDQSDTEAWDRLREMFDEWAQLDPGSIMQKSHMYLGLAIASELPAGETDTVLDLLPDHFDTVAVLNLEPPGKQFPEKRIRRFLNLWAAAPIHQVNLLGLTF